MTTENNNVEPEQNNSAEPDAIEIDDSEVITDPEELQQYILEQELLRKTAELTAEQMLSVDDDLLSPEQLKIKTEWRDAVLVMVLAEGVKESFRKILVGQGNGTYKNNKFYEGYKTALNDIYEKLMAIVPDDYKEFTKRLEEEQAQKIAEFNQKAEELYEQVQSDGTDNEV